MQTFFSQFTSGNVEKQSQRIKVQTTIIDETLLKIKKKKKERKENDMLKTVKLINCNAFPRHLMGKILIATSEI